jgi:hypothetical protein
MKAAGQIQHGREAKGLPWIQTRPQLTDSRHFKDVTNFPIIMFCNLQCLSVNITMAEFLGFSAKLFSQYLAEGQVDTTLLSLALQT